jgi:hypothetical protein
MPQAVQPPGVVKIWSNGTQSESAEASWKKICRRSWCPQVAFDSLQSLIGRCLCQVDLGYVQEAAKLAKEAGVPHFSLMTARGANSKAWASDFSLFHGLLYMKTKGQAEEFVEAQVCHYFDHGRVFIQGWILAGLATSGVSTYEGYAQGTLR